MSKQTVPTTKDCQHRSVCLRPAVIGVFGWREGDSDVNLNNPIAVFCGPHKPRLHRNQMLRNVRLLRGT